MDGVELTALRVWHQWTQRDLAEMLGVTSGFIGQLERGARVIPHRLVSPLEQVLAIGSPQQDEHALWYLLCQFRARGFLYAPTRPGGTAPIFDHRETAEGIRTRLRGAGFRYAVVAPVWRNGIARVLDAAPDEHRGSVEDEAFVRELMRNFRADRRGLIEPRYT
jgi:transcriptional regulator with XRE-family HTH domain